MEKKLKLPETVESELKVEIVQRLTKDLKKDSKKSHEVLLEKYKREYRENGGGVSALAIKVINQLQQIYKDSVEEVIAI